VYSLNGRAGLGRVREPKGRKLAPARLDRCRSAISGSAPVVVPTALAGKPLRSAEAAPDRGPVSATRSGGATARQFASGVVLSASPSSGAVAYGSKVDLMVSRGPQPRTIPAGLVGATWSSVSSQLTALKFGSAGESHVLVDRGHGCGHLDDPASGTAGRPRSAPDVAVTVSKGPQYVAVPDISDDQLSDAVAQLQNAGLTVAEVIGPPFATTAVSTNPAAGTSVLIGSSVTVYAS